MFVLVVLTVTVSICSLDRRFVPILCGSVSVGICASSASAAAAVGSYDSCAQIVRAGDTVFEVERAVIVADGGHGRDASVGLKGLSTRGSFPLAFVSQDHRTVESATWTSPQRSLRRRADLSHRSSTAYPSSHRGPHVGIESPMFARPASPSSGVGFCDGYAALRNMPLFTDHQRVLSLFTSAVSANGILTVSDVSAASANGIWLCYGQRLGRAGKGTVVLVPTVCPTAQGPSHAQPTPTNPTTRGASACVATVARVSSFGAVRMFLCR